MEATQTIDSLAAALNLPKYEDLEEANVDYVADAGAAAYEAALASGENEENAERAREQAELQAQGEIFARWYDAVMGAATALYEAHDLAIVSRYTARKHQQDLRPHYLRVVPRATWSRAANAIRDTINGVGTFYFGSLSAFLDSGPYTARQAVLQHLHWIKRRPDVYGDASARSLYERALRER